MTVRALKIKGEQVSFLAHADSAEQLITGTTTGQTPTGWNFKVKGTYLYWVDDDGAGRRAEGTLTGESRAFGSKKVKGETLLYGDESGNERYLSAFVLYESYIESLADQYQTIVGIGWAAQTFTPSISHDIRKVSLYLFKLGTPSAITVSIRDTSGDQPTGIDKAVGTIDVGDIPTGISNADWVDCTFASAYSLVAGTKYAIILRCTGTSGVHQIYWSHKVVGGYAGGNKDFSINSGSTWLGTTPNQDHHFKEYG